MEPELKLQVTTDTSNTGIYIEDKAQQRYFELTPGIDNDTLVIKVHNSSNINVGLSDPFPVRDAITYMDQAMDQAMARHLMQDCHTAEQALGLQEVKNKFRFAASRASKKHRSP